MECIRLNVIYVLNDQGRQLLNLWQQLSGRNTYTINEFKELITGKGEAFQLSGKNLSNWVLLENRLDQEIQSKSPDEVTFGGNVIRAEFTPYKLNTSDMPLVKCFPMKVLYFWDLNTCIYFLASYSSGDVVFEGEGCPIL